MYSLTYPNATDIDLSYSINFSPAGLTLNEHSVGNAVNAIQTARSSPNFVPIAAALFYQPTVPILGAVYDSLSGEGVSASQQTAFDANDYFLSAVGGQMQHWLSDECGDDANSKTLYADPVSDRAAGDPQNAGGRAVNPKCLTPRIWRVWASPFGGGANYPGDPIVGSAPVTAKGAGFGAGADYQISPSVLLGAAVGGGASSFSVPDRSTSGTVDAFHAAVYGAWREEHVYATGVLSFDQFDNAESRLATIPSITLPPPQFIDGPYLVPGFSENLKGHFSSASTSGHFEVGYRDDLGALQATPFVGLEFGSLHTDAFTENNSGSPSVIGLSYVGRNIVSLPSFLGVQFDGKTNLSDGVALNAWVRTAWKHEFDADRSTESAFIAAPGFDFVIEGAQPPRDALVANLGAKLKFGKNTSLFASFNGDFGAGSRGYTGTGGVSVSW
jgi:uncharacterized protein with beta-barrel porin domain